LITLECQPAAVAERRPEARAIHTIRPMTTTAASTIHSHSSDELDPPAAAGEAAAGVSGAWLVAGASAVGVGGAMLALRLGRLAVAVRLGVRLEIAVLMAPPTGPLPPHPAAKGPMTRAIAATASPFLSRVIPVLRSSRSCCVQAPSLDGRGHAPGRKLAIGAPPSPHPSWVASADVVFDVSAGERGVVM
jgi:hypothetical protein